MKATSNLQTNGTPKQRCACSLLSTEQIDSIVSKYEYKNPSYRLIDRQNSESSTPSLKESRYTQVKNNTWKSTCKEKDDVTILVAGDLLCQEAILQAYSTKAGGYDFSPCFEYLAPFLQSADLSIGNLETPISRTAPYRGEIITHDGPYYCNAPQEYLLALKYAGFDMLTTANNHTIDAGARGLLETLNECKKLNFIQTGTFSDKDDEKYIIVDVCGIKVGFTAFGSTYNTMDENLTRRGRIALLNTYSKNRAGTIIQKMKADGAEYTVCFPHWGLEYKVNPSQKQHKVAEELCELGYDCILGSHSHVLQSFELYNGKIPIAYSLGNIISSLNLKKEARSLAEYPALCCLRLKRTPSGIESKVSFIPCRIVRNTNHVPFTVIPYSNETASSRNIKKLIESAPQAVSTMLKIPQKDLELDFGSSCQMKTIRDIRELGRYCENTFVKNEKPLRSAKHSITEKEGLNEGLINRKSSLYHVTDEGASFVGIQDYYEIIKSEKEIDGIPVVSIGSQLGGNDIVRLFYTPSTARIIKSGAFKDFSRLESVRLFSNLIEIESEAFMNCSSLTGVRIPRNCKKIGNRCFSNCKKLISITIPVSVCDIADDAFSGSENVVIYGEAESYAEQYANNHGINFAFMPLPLPEYQSLKQDEHHYYGNYYPWTIRFSCRALGYRLPIDATYDFPPSHYLDSNTHQIQDAKELKKILGDSFPSISNTDYQEDFSDFMNSSHTDRFLNHSRIDSLIFFTDWLLFAKKQGFSIRDYYSLKLFEKSLEERNHILDSIHRSKPSPIDIPSMKGLDNMTDTIKANERVEVIFGPHNGKNDKHPSPILAVCRKLGTPLPEDAVCGNQPSFYLGSDAFSDSYSDVLRLLRIGSKAANELELQRKFRMFRNKYQSQKCLVYTKTDMVVYFCDWFYYARESGFTHNCYFDYELYNKELEIRETFLNEGFRTRVHKACASRQRDIRRKFLDKAQFNTIFAEYIHRDWIDTSTCSFDDFAAFVSKHESFFAKPVRGTGGKGARVITVADSNLEELFDECKADELICEEVVQQHPELAEFNSSTLNTVRITTLLCADNTPRIVLTVARFGRAGNCVDNFHGGGVGAIVDIDTGIIKTEAINMGHERSPIHPDSGKSILGFHYPEWEKVKKAVLHAATLVPEMRNIGWDVSVTANGDIEFIEGNGRPNYDVLQSPDQVGRRYVYMPYLAEIEELNAQKTAPSKQGSSPASSKQKNGNATKQKSQQSAISAVKKRIPKQIKKPIASVLHRISGKKRNQ